jgi:hypothetical protein
VGVPSASTSRITHLKNDANPDFGDLCSFLERVFSLLFPPNLQGQIAQTMITTTLLEKHVEDILQVSLLVGWIPKSQASENFSPLDTARPLTVRLLQLWVVATPLATSS